MEPARVSDPGATGADTGNTAWSNASATACRAVAAAVPSNVEGDPEPLAVVWRAEAAWIRKTRLSSWQAPSCNSGPHAVIEGS